MSDGPWSNQQTADALTQAVSEWYEAQELLMEADPTLAVTLLTEQRDSARRLAVALEARLEQAGILLCTAVVSNVHPEIAREIVAFLYSPLPEITQPPANKGDLA